MDISNITCVIIQGGPKVGTQYIVNYFVPTFGPLCIQYFPINAVKAKIYFCKYK